MARAPLLSLYLVSLTHSVLFGTSYQVPKKIYSCRLIAILLFWHKSSRHLWRLKVRCAVQSVFWKSKVPIRGAWSGRIIRSRCNTLRPRQTGYIKPPREASRTTGWDKDTSEIWFTPWEHLENEATMWILSLHASTGSWTASSSNELTMIRWIWRGGGT